MVRKPPWEGYGQMMLLKALNAAINESRLILKKGIQLFLYFAVRVPMSSVFLLPHCSLS